MGDIRLILEPILKTLGAEVVVPPEPNRETVALGARLAPETICLPFKVTLGNIVRALELGADTLVSVSGSWSCRFGYYGRLQADICRDLGYRFQLLELRRDRMGEIVKQIFRLSGGNPVRSLVRTFRAFRLGWFKATALERTYELFRQQLPFAGEPRECIRLKKQIVDEIARTDDVQKLAELRRTAGKRFSRLAGNGRDGCLRVKLIGESYCTIEPFVNFDIVTRLGELGVEVDPFLTGPRWLGFHGFRLNKREVRRAQYLAKEYWRYCVGGEDANSVGHLIMAARAGYDGVIHIHPFACMPSTVVQPALFAASRDYDIPLLSISIDEHTAETGFLTRVEAFVSLLERKQRGRFKKGGAVYVSGASQPGFQRRP
jgi:predicted nucleotide-binding protein (sugar kinase/HSP70/actin superfamily)